MNTSSMNPLSASTSSPKLLRAALRFDAAGCAIFAIATAVLLADSPHIMAQLDVPAGVLAVAGALALVGVPLFWSMSNRQRISRTSVWIVLVTNSLWAVISIVAVAAGWIQPTGTGTVIIVVQAMLTALIAELEFIGLRRTRAEE